MYKKVLCWRAQLLHSPYRQNLSLMKMPYFTTTRGKSYFYTYEPLIAKPTLLFFHGFPSHSADWRHQIEYFSSLGYGVLAPDLLGFGKSDAPEEVSEYRLKLISQDIVELLDHLGLRRIIAIGHDLGSNVAASLALYFPSRVSAMVFIAVGVSKPGIKFNIDAIHQFTKQALGFEMFGYVSWLGRDDPHQTLEQHAASVMSLMFAKDLANWDKFLHPVGAMKLFVEKDEKVEVGEWYTEPMRRDHLETFAAQDGYKGATRWYRGLVENISLSDQSGFENMDLSQPSLFIAHGGAMMGMAQQQQMLSEWIPNLKTVTIDNAGHWPQLEQPSKTNEAIHDFIEGI